MLRNIFIAAAILIFGAGTIYAQKGKFDQPLTDELARIIEERTRIIFDAIEEDRSASWAGRYFQGDHHPTELIWEPKTGFVVTASRHTFSPSWINYGAVRFENDRLRLFPEVRKDSQYAYTLPSEYVGILWGDWRFLVPPDELERFAYAVHSGSEFEIWQFFVKPGASGGRGETLPEMEDLYLKIVKRLPIRVKVLKVSRTAEHILATEVTLDGGRDKGIIEGMTFYYADSGNSENISVRVQTVNERTATAIVSSLGGTHSDLEGPKRGMIFSSKMPHGFIEPG